MPTEFHAERNPSKELSAELMALAPANPFYTYSYIEARRMLGFEPWSFILHYDIGLVSACTAFMSSGYLCRLLEITSLPSIPHNNGFWDNLLQFCSRESVSYLEINSYASAQAIIPTIHGEIGRRTRCEYILELKTHELWSHLSSNHARNIKRGRRAGLEVRRVIDEEACHQHARLVELSMGRRKRRGESVREEVDVHSFVAMTNTGAGELFQAFLDGRVVSSIFVLIANKGGYYQSAGTSSEGMACGASHLLVHEIANTLKARSKESFNLGGADQLNPGLARFKAGFGSSQVKLESAQFFLGSKIKRKLAAAAQWLRENSI